MRRQPRKRRRSEVHARKLRAILARRAERRFAFRAALSFLEV